METIKTDESQIEKKTVGYYRERLKSLNPKEKEYRQEKKAYELSSADFLKRYTKEFLIDPELYYDEEMRDGERIRSDGSVRGYNGNETRFLRQIENKRLNIAFLKNGVEYMISNSEPITTLELSDAIGVDPRLQRFFLREFVDDKLLSPKRAKVIEKTYIEDPREVRHYSKDNFPLWKISDMEKAEKYVAFLEELES